MRTFLLLYYLFVNLLFLYKYTARVDELSVLSIIFLYTIIFAGGMFFFNKVSFSDRINSYVFFKIYYITITIVVSFFFIWINYYIDGKTLNVDRWSALSIGIKSVLNGQYPYNVTDHLGGRTSNLPGLFIIGLPFFLLKNIGLLQVFSFILLSYIIYIYYNDNSKRALALLLFLYSPAYFWEIITKSDLMSNFIIVLAFIIYWYRKYNKKIFNKPLSLGIFSGILVFTRLIVFIPLSIFLGKAFFSIDNRKKVIFIFGIVFTISIISLPIILSADSMKTMLKYNPFSLQTSQVPIILSFFFMLVPMLFVIKKEYSLQKIIFYSGIFILLPVLYNFFYLLIEFGVKRSIFDSIFDISYFNMSLPFFLLLIPAVFNRSTNS